MVPAGLVDLSTGPVRLGGSGGGTFLPRAARAGSYRGRGWGREALALIEKGYSVVAFDPAEGLIKALRARAGGETRLRTYAGAMPICLTWSIYPINAASTLRVNHRSMPQSSAGPAGTLRTDDERLDDALARFSRLTRGPILASYYAPLPPSTAARSGGRLEHWIRKRMTRRGHSVFSIDVGFYRVLSHAEVNQLLDRTGLTVLQSQQTGVWPTSWCRVWDRTALRPRLDSRWIPDDSKTVQGHQDQIRARQGETDSGQSRETRGEPVPTEHERRVRLVSVRFPKDMPGAAGTNAATA